LTALDFVVPDVIPFADELGLLLLTLLVGRWKARRADTPPTSRRRRHRDRIEHSRPRLPMTSLDVRKEPPWA